MTHKSHDERSHEHGGHEPHEHQSGTENSWKGLHPAWWMALGVILTGLVVLAWMGYPWF